MIIFVRTTTIRPGMAKEATQWALDVAKYVSDNYSDADIEVVRNISGPRNQIHWSVRYESLAAAEAVGAKLATDRGYLAMLVKVKELFDSPLVDHYYQVVDKG